MKTDKKTSVNIKLLHIHRQHNILRKEKAYKKESNNHILFQKKGDMAHEKHMDEEDLF